MLLKVFTAFSGYDSQCMALDRLGIGYELVGWSEIDKYAIQAHNAVYPQYGERNYGDISKIDWANVPDFDLFTYSFPCQDISSTGKQGGLEEGSGTRSSLLWECRKAIEAKKPKYLLMENVKALTQKKFLPYLQKWMACLEGMGYSNHAKVLNAKDYGVPQNRERVFMVSVLGGGGYGFPKPFELKSRLSDVLEEDVDEKYYLSKKVIDTFIERNKINEDKGNRFRFEPTDGDCVASSVLTKPGSRHCDNYIKEPIACAMRGREVQCLTPKRTEYGKQVRKEYESGTLNESCHNMQQLEPREDGVCNTITSVQKDCLIIEHKIVQKARGLNKGGGHEISPAISSNSWGCNNIPIEPKILSYTRDADGKVVDRHFKDVANTIHCGTGSGGNTDSFVFEPNITGVIYKGRALKEGGGLYLHNSDDFNQGSLDGISRTLKATKSDAGVVQDYRIRKLTPRECFRLMASFRRRY